MAITTLRSAFCGPRLAARPACLSLAVLLAFAGAGAPAQADDSFFGDTGLLVVSRSVYDNASSNVRDVLRNTTASGAANEHFVTLREAGFGEVLRGVSLAPGARSGKWF